ncbi:hypothetical protein GCM10027614_66700 [Micromonospora vulcania]
MDIDEAAGVRAAQECGGEFVATDVADEAAVRDLFDGVAERHGRVDIAFNNAGISPPDDDSILDTGLDAWERVLRVNTTSVYLCCKYAIPHMRRQGKGSIINTASFVALMGAATSQIAYTASKGGVLAMTRELGVQFAREDPGQRALSRPGGDPAAAGTLRRRSGAGRPPPRTRADGPVRGTGGDRRRGGVPGQRRRLVHDRRAVRGRRRHHRRVRHASMTRPLIGISAYVEPADWAVWRGVPAVLVPRRTCGR